MPDLHYDDPALAELYDIDNGWSVDRDFYLCLAGTPPKTVLDLGCGTGLLCLRCAALGHDVTGVDPSPAMLAVARRQPHGERIAWIEATAQTFRSSKRFDLIIMTGHAFQALENDADIASALATMAAHLAPTGRAVFESRNPAIDWARKWQGYSAAYDHNGTPIRQTTNVVGWTGDRLTFEQHYAFPDRTFVSTSTLRFASRAEIEAAVAKAGLVVDAFYGDWQRGPFDPATSEEMVFSLRLP
jgi:SAM-dependent methyltransferase